MSVCCGSLRAAPSPLVTAHLLADSSCHTYYPNLAEHRWEKERAHSITCHIVRIVLSIDHYPHTRPVLSHTSLRLVLSP